VADPDRIWKVHDHGKVVWVENMDKNCQENPGFHYLRVGLYYVTKKWPQNFCDLHFVWKPTFNGATEYSAGHFSAPSESVEMIETTRGRHDRDKWNGSTEPVYDARGNIIMDSDDYSPNLNLSDGGNVVFYGDFRPDAELVQEAKKFSQKDVFKDRIGKKRNVECWLLGPVYLFPGDDMTGSLVVRLEGRFEEGQGFQHCTLWQSHYVDDGTLIGGWTGRTSEETIRQAVSVKTLPPYANGLVWKFGQYKASDQLTECTANELTS
jgi:hypothetical protein